MERFGSNCQRGETVVWSNMLHFFCSVPCKGRYSLQSSLMSFWCSMKQEVLHKLCITLHYAEIHTEQWSPSIWSLYADCGLWLWWHSSSIPDRSFWNSFRMDGKCWFDIISSEQYFQVNLRPFLITTLFYIHCLTCKSVLVDLSLVHWFFILFPVFLKKVFI